MLNKNRALSVAPIFNGSKEDVLEVLEVRGHRPNQINHCRSFSCL